MNKIVCLNVGAKYKDHDYTGKLYRSLCRNLSESFQFECITKSPYPTWWGKLTLFGPKERIVFLDLDNIIVGNVDFLFEYQGNFCILHDFYRYKGYGSAVMSIAPNFGEQIKADFILNSKFIMANFPGDQNFIESKVDSADQWQDLYPNKIVSYKAHDCAQGLPPDARMVCYHGVPKPHEVEHDWMREHWK